MIIFFLTSSSPFFPFLDNGNQFWNKWNDSQKNPKKNDRKSTGNDWMIAGVIVHHFIKGNTRNKINTSNIIAVTLRRCGRLRSFVFSSGGWFAARYDPLIWISFSFSFSFSFWFCCGSKWLPSETSTAVGNYRNVSVLPAAGGLRQFIGSLLGRDDVSKRWRRHAACAPRSPSRSLASRRLSPGESGGDSAGHSPGLDPASRPPSPAYARWMRG